jgi:hypothetical protein
MVEMRRPTVVHAKTAIRLFDVEEIGVEGIFCVCEEKEEGDTGSRRERNE